MVNKFLTLAKGTLSQDRANRAVEMILQVEQLSNLDTLLEALCAMPLS